MKRHQILIVLFLLLWITAALSGCNSWRRIQELIVMDPLAGERISLPVEDQYGLYLPASTIISTDDTLIQLKEQIMEKWDKEQACAIAFYSDEYLLIEVSLGEKLSLTLLSQNDKIQAKQMSKWPYNQKKHAYLYTDFNVMVYDGEKSVEALLPLHLIKGKLVEGEKGW